MCFFSQHLHLTHSPANNWINLHLALKKNISTGPRVFCFGLQWLDEGNNSWWMWHYWHPFNTLYPFTKRIFWPFCNASLMCITRGYQLYINYSCMIIVIVSWRGCIALLYCYCCYHPIVGHNSLSWITLITFTWYNGHLWPVGMHLRLPSH